MENITINEIIEFIEISIEPLSHSSTLENEELSNKTVRFLELALNSYVLVTWPDSQDLMDEDWFEEEAILDAWSKFGSSAYLVPLKRIL